MIKPKVQIPIVFLLYLSAISLFFNELYIQWKATSGHQISNQEAANLLELIEKAKHYGSDSLEIDRNFFMGYCLKRGYNGKFEERLAAFESQAQAWWETNSKFAEESSNEQSKQSSTNLPPLPESSYLGFPEIAVINTADDGAGTLRDAIRQAETVGGNRRIVFRLPQSDPNYDSATGTWRITLKSVIYIFASRILIDGLSQSALFGDTNPKGPEIVIVDGSGASFDALQNGELVFVPSLLFIYEGDQNWIRGFNFPTISQISHGAIGISALSKQPGIVASGNQVTDNFIGVSADGETFPAGNNAAGVYLDAGAENSVVERNIISLIHLPIWINGSFDRNIAISNIVRSNIIGTNKTGNRRFPITAIRSGNDGNPATSIFIKNRPQNNIIENNIIAGTRAGGVGEYNITNDEVPQGNIIRNNRIGVGPNGENIAPVVPPDNQLSPETDQGAYAVGIFGQQDDVITGNIIGNFGLAGIYLRSWAGNPVTAQTTQITDNQISNCPIGIEVSGIIRRTEIKGNQLSNCTKGGIVLCETPLDPSAIYQFPKPREETLMTQNILVSQNTFSGVGGPGIGLTPRCKDVVETGYVPNLSTTLQAGGPNLYQPSVRIESAIRQTDGTVKVTGISPQTGTIEWYASSRAPRPTAPTTDVMAYGLGTFLMATPVSSGNFSISLPASSVMGVTALTATLTVNHQTSEFARTVGITGNDPNPDTMKPTVMVASPATGLVVESRPGAQVGVVWQSSDNIGVTGHWINLNGQRNGTPFEENLAAGLPGTATSFTLSIAENDAFTQGQITVSATDATGNVGMGQSGIFSVVAPPPPDTVKPTVSQVTLSKAKIKRKKDPNVTISWSSSDNIGVASQEVLYATDGTTFSTTVVTGLTGTQQQFAWTVPASLAKTKVARVKVIARDAASNSGEAVSGTFVVK